MSKKTVSFMTVFLLLVFCCSGVYAGVTPYSQYLIEDCSSSIAPSTSGNLLVYGRTYAYFTVDEVSITIYLQQWNGSSWVNVGSPIVGRKYNDSRVAVIAERVVEKNKFYRTRSIHEAKYGGNTEKVELYSNSYYHQ